MEKFIRKATDITINVKGEQVVLISKEEVVDFILDTYGIQFSTRASAKRITGISYLGDVNASAKIKKGLKQDYHTYVMYLSPYKSIFGNVCAKGEHCHKPCLNTSGRVKMDVKEFKILRARYFRTMLFYINRDFFNAWLFAEIESASKKYDNFMVRLNGTSDLSPKLFKVNGVMVLDAFKDVQFYDYTKIPTRLELLSSHTNYHITFSFDGYNMKECRFAQAMGVNVSVVVDGDMPSTFMGKPMFTMDDTDLRPLDSHKGCFGYLKLKQTLNKEYDTKFIVKL
jgi:hypothetical protein